MPTIDLTDGEHAAIMALIRRAIEQDRFPLARTSSRCRPHRPRKAHAANFKPPGLEGSQNVPTSGRFKRTSRQRGWREQPLKESLRASTKLQANRKPHDLRRLPRAATRRLQAAIVERLRNRPRRRTGSLSVTALRKVSA
jgi:hypothetical protein